MSSENDSNIQDTDEFQNIDLDAETSNIDTINVDHLQSSFLIANQNLLNIHDDQKEETPTEEEESTKANQMTTLPLSETSNQYLIELSNQLMEDYAKYFHLQPTAQIEELNECIENLLTHMEEFYGLIERIRDQGNLCLDKFQIQLLPKLQECQKLFRFIDKLERIVNHVALQLSLMEREVARAEKMMGTKTSTVKKLFSFLNQSTASSSEMDTSRYRYVPPDIFKTEDLMKM